MGSLIFKIKTYAELIKFEHTVFALPFAYIGAILARKALPSLEEVFWITLALTCARSAAMGLNRVIDRFIDAANPRTANRHLPRGLLGVMEVKFFIALSLVIFIYCVYILSPAHLIFTPLIIFFLAGYSYTKRFTWLSHIILGITDGFAPIGGWIAVTQKTEITAFFLGAFVALWIAGFDIIYAALDLDFDREYGLYSMPLNLGLKNALFIAKGFHFLAAGLLLAVYFTLNMGWLYLTGVLLSTALLWYENSIISPFDLSKANVASFNVNGIVSIILFVFTVLDVIIFA